MVVISGYVNVFVVINMTKESRYGISSSLIFKETFESEQITRKINNGVPTDVDFSNGKGTFNGTSSKVNYDLDLNGTYSVRVRCNPTSFADYRYLLDCQGSNADGTGRIQLLITSGNINITSGTSYVNGVATTTTVAGVNNEIVITGITLTEGTGANLSLIGSQYNNANEFLGTIDIVEIYEGTLTPGEVEAMYHKRKYRGRTSEHIMRKMADKGFVYVPADYITGAKGFFVSKYEMKIKGIADGNIAYNSDYVAESRADGTPWVNISQTESIAECTALQDSFRVDNDLRTCTVELITNNQRMSIARNIENVKTNWSTGTVGSGYIYSGHNDGTPANSLAASIDDNDGYSGTGQSSGTQRRTLFLSNGQCIWDFSGNVRQWCSDTIQEKDQPDGFNDDGTENNDGFNWFGYNQADSDGEYIDETDLGNTTLSRNDLFMQGDYNSSNGVGRIYTNSDRSSASTTLCGLLFGGYWHSGTNAGPLALLLYYGPSFRHTSIGFRCVVVP